MALYTVAEGHTLTGAFVDGALYSAGDQVELEPPYAAFYLEKGVLTEGASAPIPAPEPEPTPEPEPEFS